jgi:hypothetical protein
MLSAEIFASRESPEPLPMTSSGKSSPRVSSQPWIVAWPDVVVAGVPFISAAIASRSERAIMLLEYLLVTRTISESGSDSCVSRRRAAGGVGARSMPPRNCPPSCRHNVTNVP